MTKYARRWLVLTSDGKRWTVRRDTAAEAVDAIEATLRRYFPHVMVTSVEER